MAAAMGFLTGLKPEIKFKNNTPDNQVTLMVIYLTVANKK